MITEFGRRNPLQVASLSLLWNRLERLGCDLVVGMAPTAIGTWTELPRKAIGLDVEFGDVTRDAGGAAAFVAFAWELLQACLGHTGRPSHDSSRSGSMARR